MCLTKMLKPVICLLAIAGGSAAQTVVGSARLMCGDERIGANSGAPITGAVINDSAMVITDLEVELSIITRDKHGILRRQRDTRFVVVPSMNEVGLVSSLQPGAHITFSIPAKEGDRTCRRLFGDRDSVPNVATIAITRINSKSLLGATRDGHPPKQAPLESMLQVPREWSKQTERGPTQFELLLAMRQQNELLQEKIINKQLKDCLAQGTWACSYNNDTNINVVISEK